MVLSQRSPVALLTPRWHFFRSAATNKVVDHIASVRSYRRQALALEGAPASALGGHAALGYAGLRGATLLRTGDE